MGSKKRPAATKSLFGKRPGQGELRHDVVIVGGGPAGSVLAWKLAREGMKVVLLDRARFPRDKVCGDYVEPRGLRLLDKMGCLRALERTSPLPITHSATYVDGNLRYVGKIPFYGLRNDLPPHGYIIPRQIFDNLLLETAMKAGAAVHQETYAESFGAGRNGVEVRARRDGRRLIYRGHMVVGADGVNSAVARTAGLLAEDPRHIAVSQRAYADGFERDIGEATFFFDRDFFPGYGWVFPMTAGRVNLGVGVLLETCQREDIKVPQLFRDFLQKTKRSHPCCAKLRLCQPPIGGIVKTYGGAGSNYFNRGLLIGDAGSFVDPMTGEGITPAMESALIAARVILERFAAGRFDAHSLSCYESEYRRYFDPSMIFLDLCAATLRNTRLGESWNRALERGCQLARKDVDFAKTTGACFGGLEISPSGILSQLWAHMACDLLAAGPQSVLEFLAGGAETRPFTLREIAAWMGNWWASVWDAPLWHARWSLDVQRKWIRTLSIMRRNSGDPRAEGLA